MTFGCIVALIVAGYLVLAALALRRLRPSPCPGPFFFCASSQTTSPVATLPFDYSTMDVSREPM
jgi:hypothetical protein